MTTGHYGKISVENHVVGLFTWWRMVTTIPAPGMTLSAISIQNLQIVPQAQAFKKQVHQRLESLNNLNVIPLVLVQLYDHIGGSLLDTKDGCLITTIEPMSSGAFSAELAVQG